MKTDRLQFCAMLNLLHSQLLGHQGMSKVDLYLAEGN